MHRSYRTAFALYAVFVANSLFAEEDPFFSQLPVVASVSRLPQRLADAPAAVTVLDRETIRASGARDLNDILRLVPGFHTYPNNTDAARVTYHGLTDEDYSPRVQVLLDGRSLHSPLFRSGVNWATVPVAIEDIERIEVVRGSNTVSYGTNAFLGVINIITVDPALTRGFSVAANHGNQGVRDYYVRQGGRLGEVGDFRFTYQQKNDSGLTDRFDWQDRAGSRLFDLRADLGLGEYDTLQLGLAHVEANTLRGRLAKAGGVLIGGSDPGWPLHDYAQSSSYLQLLWRRSLNADADFQLRYSYAADWASDRYVANESGYLYDVDEFGDRGVRHEVEAQHNFAPSERTRLVWGTGWRQDAVSSGTLLVGENTVKRSISRIFGNLEWKPVSWFTGNAGLSREWDSMAGDRTAPRIGANFHFNNENTLRFGFSRAFRTGSIFDYRGNEVAIPYARADGLPLSDAEKAAATARLFAGNPNLKPERLDTYEIGYLGDWRAIRMSLDVRVFDEHIPNRQMRVFIEPPDPDYSAAVQKVRMFGVEYTWKWQPLDATRLMVSQSFIRSRSEFLDSADVAAMDPAKLPNLDLFTERSAPRHSTAILLSQQLPYGFEMSTAGYWFDMSKWTRNSEARAYQRVDARLARRFKLGALGGEVAYTVQSLNGSHGEFKASGLPADRIVEQRQWLTLRFDL